MKLKPYRLQVQWVDAGLLRGHRLPGSGDRRILRGELVWFIEQHGMPSAWLKDVGPDAA